jgi:hypothetical protein
MHRGTQRDLCVVTVVRQAAALLTVFGIIAHVATDKYNTAHTHERLTKFGIVSYPDSKGYLASVRLMYTACQGKTRFVLGILVLCSAYQLGY